MRKLIVLLVLSFCIGSVSAATIPYSASVPLQSTYWSQVLTLPKFDTSLGTLKSVTFQLSGRVQGSASFESLDADPATVKMTLGAVLTMLRSDNSVITTASPSVSTSDAASRYDGVMDLGGTSGVSRSGLSATKVESLYLPAGSADLSAYAGPGTFNVTVTASGNSRGNGAGNLVLLFRTSAAATAQVIYEYTPVPEPSSLMVMSLGAMSLLGLARYRRR